MRESIDSERGSDGRLRGAGHTGQPAAGGRRVLRRLVVLLLIIAAIVWSAPYVVSTRRVTGLIVSAVNDRLRGEIRIGGLSLRWLGPCRLDGLQVLDTSGREVLRAERITLDGGVAGGLASPEHFGRLKITRPFVTLYVSDDGGISLLEALRLKRPSGRPLPEPTGRIDLRDGSLRVVGPNGRTYDASGFQGRFDLQTLKMVKAVISLELAGGQLPGKSLTGAIKTPTPAGRLAWSGAFGIDGDVVFCRGRGRIGQFRAVPGDAVQEQLKFEHDVDIDRRADVISLRNVRIASGPSYVRAAGTIKEYRTTGVLDIRGRYELSWPQIGPLLKELAPAAMEDVRLAGTTANDFTITGPAYQPTLRPVFGGIDAGVNVGWESANVYGLAMGEALFKLALQDGRVNMPVVTIPASTGLLRIGGAVDFSTGQPTLRIKGPIKILENVPISTELSRSFLSRFNPVFMRMEGEVSVLLNDLELPLGKDINSGGSGAGRLDLTKIRIIPGRDSLMARLLNMGGLGMLTSRVVKVGSADFVIKNGRIHTDGLIMTFANTFDIEFSGSVGFDDTLDMYVFMPIRPSLLRQLDEQIKIRIPGPLDGLASGLANGLAKIHIKGTRQNPVLDLVGLDIDSLIKPSLENLFDPAGLDLFRFLPVKKRPGEPDSESDTIPGE